MTARRVLRRGARPWIVVLLALAAAGAAALGLTASARAGDAHVLTRSSGPVTATLTWTEHEFEPSDVHLTIVREGVSLLDENILDENGEKTIDLPQVLRVRDLDGDGEPEIVVDLYTRGAHCCLYSLFYRYDAAAVAYVLVRHVWGNPGYRVRDLDGDGVPELRSADDRFAYEFTSYAGSGLPVQIWRFDAAGLVDVTAAFPRVVRADASSWWRLYARERSHESSDVRGIFAAWLADKYVLGEKADGLLRLANGRRAGYFSGPSQGAPSWPAGRRYATELRRFLARLGYGH